MQVDAAMVASVRQARRRGTWVNWFCDARRSPDDVRPLAAAYDAVFVADRATGRDARRAGPSAGALPARRLRSVDSPARCARATASAPTSCSSGTATPHRERQLSELVEFGVAVWGPGWRRTKLRDYCRGELLGHEDYIRAYAGASVAVNVACAESERRSAGPGAQPPPVRAGRHRRAAGRRGAPRPPRALPRGLGDSGRALAAELRSLTAEALHDRAWAEQVAAGARQRALAEHTYMHRLSALMQAVVGVEV